VAYSMEEGNWELVAWMINHHASAELGPYFLPAIAQVRALYRIAPCGSMALPAGNVLTCFVTTACTISGAAGKARHACCCRGCVVATLTLTAEMQFYKLESLTCAKRRVRSESCMPCSLTSFTNTVRQLLSSSQQTQLLLLPPPLLPFASPGGQG
jgi:hypothetical protein